MEVERVNDSIGRAVAILARRQQVLEEVSNKSRALRTRPPAATAFTDLRPGAGACALDTKRIKFVLVFT